MARLHFVDGRFADRSQTDRGSARSHPVHHAGQEDWTAVGEPEKPARLACGIAETGRRRREGCTRPDAALEGEYDARYLSANRP